MILPDDESRVSKNPFITVSYSSALSPVSLARPLLVIASLKEAPNFSPRKDGEGRVNPFSSSTFSVVEEKRNSGLNKYISILSVDFKYSIC